MPRPKVSPPPPKLPERQFVVIQDENLTEPAGVNDNLAKSYGFNDFSEFKRPDHYIRHIEPLEIDLAKQVEYDMDEQDQEWLEAVNTERRTQSLGVVTYETFEIIMDRLEKEWFDLTKNIPKPDLALPSEDSTCSICDDAEGENSNAIVFCDGCNLAVHQDCYGVPYIPEGQWLCRKCTVSPEAPVECELCPNEGGAFKQTTHGDWVHLLCAIWVPETRVANDVFMEPVTGLDKINKQRWKLKCSICGVRSGACIQCAKNTCFVAFHTTCARGEKLLLPMKTSQGPEAALAAYCERHLPKEHQDARLAALAAEGNASDNSSSSEDSVASRRHRKQETKSARAHAKTYRPGPPLVPAIIVNRIMAYIQKIRLAKKLDFLHLCCRYWSLKREARRGAPLLKRLHLEPWTAKGGLGANSKDGTEGAFEKKMKLQQLQALKADLERIRFMAEATVRREAKKVKQANLINDVLRATLFSHEGPLRMAFEKITGHDRQNLFKDPVSKVAAPDYYDIIKKPMFWSVIDEKLDRHAYWDLQEFEDDINLVLQNAQTYNLPQTSYHKTALRLQSNIMKTVFEDLQKLVISSNSVIHTISPLLVDNLITPDPPRGDLVLQLESNSSNDFPFPNPSLPQAEIGDLEPALSALKLLITPDEIAEDTAHVLRDIPLASLLAYDVGEMKPSPPPVAPKRTKRARSTKSSNVSLDSTSSKEVVNQDDGKAPSLAEARAKQAELDASPGFQIRVTRKSASRIDGDNGKAGPGPSTSAARRALKDKEQAATAVIPGEAPVVQSNDISNKQSFSFFETGWILPEDQKRGNRQSRGRQEEIAEKVQRRRSRTGSKLATYTTAASENETLRREVSAEDKSQEHIESAPEPVVELNNAEPMELDPKFEKEQSSSVKEETMADVDNASADEDEDEGRPRKHAGWPKENIVKDAEGNVIVEHIDTPETRRQRMKTLREARLAAKAAGELAANSPGPQVNASNTDGSDLSELTSSGSDAEPRISHKEDGKPRGSKKGKTPKHSKSRKSPKSATVPEASRKSTRPTKSTPKARAAREDVEDTVESEQEVVEEGQESADEQIANEVEEDKANAEPYPNGSVVWVKYRTYPWWPARIYEKGDPQIPKKMDKMADDTAKKSKTKIYRAQFFDENFTWCFPGVDKIKPLGHDDIDGQLLTMKGKNQKETDNRKEAYRTAKSILQGSESE